MKRIYLFTVLFLLISNSQALMGELLSEEEEIIQLQPCQSFTDDSEGHKLYKNALEHLYHFDVVRHSLYRFKAKGMSFCATGFPLEKDIFKNYRYFSQIEVRDSSNQLVHIIPTLYLSPSVQADHNSDKKAWTALSYKKMTPFLNKIVKNFKAATLIDNFEMEKPADLYAIAQQQSWWNQDTASNFQFTQVYSEGEEQNYLGGWMENVTPSSPLFAQHFSAQYVLFKYNKLTKTLELSGVEPAFVSILSPADDLLKEATAAEPQAHEDKVNHFIDLGDLKEPNPSEETQ